MSIKDHCKSALSLTAISLNLLFWSLPLFAIALAKFLMPPRRDTFQRWMTGIYRAAVRFDDWWLRSFLGIHWRSPIGDLAADRSYVLVANHQSWSDTLLVQSVITGNGGPPVKFLVKRSLIWIPVVGLIIWAFDFPVLERSRSIGDENRRRERDLDAIERACEPVRQHPAGLMNFVEGTRFTQAKHSSSGSPYRHLLSPRPGGFAAIVDALAGDAEAVVDLTLDYRSSPSFWEFLAGKQRNVTIHATQYPLADMPRGRDALSAWLQARWQDKDCLLDDRTDPAPEQASTT